MKLVENDFDKTYDELSKINDPAFVSNAKIDDKAKRAFYYGFDAEPYPYLDIEAFHKAFDEALKEAGLDDIFDSEGLLINKGTWGKIKDVKNPELLKALKKLWGAQFSTQSWQPKIAHTKKYYDEKEAAYNKLTAEVENINKVLVSKLDQELIAKIEHLCQKSFEPDAIRVSSDKRVDWKSRYRSKYVVSELGADIQVNLWIGIKLPMEKIVKNSFFDKDSYSSEPKWIHSTSSCVQSDGSVDLNKLIDDCNKMLNGAYNEIYSDHYHEKINKLRADFKIGPGAEINDCCRWSKAYFLRGADLYILHSSGSGRYGGGSLYLYPEAKQAVDLEEIPDSSELKLIALTNDHSWYAPQYPNRGLADGGSEIYYNSKLVDKKLWPIIGITNEPFDDWQGAGNGSGRHISRGEQVREPLRNLGLDTVEVYSWSQDSTD